MPCDSIVEQSVEFEQAQGHEDLLVDALKELGYRVETIGDRLMFNKGAMTGTYVKGQFRTSTYTGEQFNVDAVKQSFSKQVVKKAAKQYGWAVVEKGHNKFEIRKRV
jgi:hypothetical protein